MKLLVIDGNSLMNRAFYGIKLLSNKKGQFTNAVFGFIKMLNNLKNECSPDATVVAFDLKAPTFRHKMYSQYKAGRKPMPDELRSQMVIIKELLPCLGCHILEKEGWEADDILGTLADGAKENDRCFIATGDRDSLQLVSEKTTVLLATTKLGNVEYTPKKIMEEYGVTPIRMIEIKALMGDSSDNIPGVAGIGPKTAGDLIKEFNDIETLYKKIDEAKISDKMRQKLLDGHESAVLSKALGTISTNAPVSKNYEDYLNAEKDENKAVSILASLEAFSLIDLLGLNANSVPDNNTEAEKLIFSYKDITVGEGEKIIENETQLYFLCKFNLTSISDFYFSVNECVYHISSGEKDFSQFINRILSDNSIEKYSCDSKKLYTYAIEKSIEIKNLRFDAILAGYILNPSSNDYSVSRFSAEYGIKISVENAPEEIYCDCAMLKAVCERLSKEIAENAQEDLLHNIEMPLAEVLASMELEGFKVEQTGIENFSEKLQKDIEILQDEIFSLVGYEFNINSPKQLGEALFEKLGLPAKKKTKSGYSTNADVLESLEYAHPVIRMILDYRSFSKLKSTYCDGLLKVISDDGRIHSTLNQTETRTGRISSAEPNLQNIPVRSELGREMRKFFVAEDNNILVDADYSQIELRVLAHIADDEEMIRAFNNNCDIHTATAAQVFNMPDNLVTPIMRSRAKAVNFGIVYGIGAFSLAKDIGVTRKEADNYIKGYLEHYSGVKKYMDDVITSAKADGYVTTLYNRKRYLPELTASNAMLRNFGERVARNMPIQGTAADIIKIAMIRVYNRIRNEKLNARLIMQIHDELIIECPENEKDAVMTLLKEEMENACEMKVHLDADVHFGKTWYDAKG